MKRSLIYIVIIILSLPLYQTALPASIRSEAKTEIREAKDLLKAIEKTKKIQNFIPYRNYHDAKVYLDTAIYQFEEEREYEEAALYAVLARVELETTLTIAITQFARYTKLQIERVCFKELASKASRRAVRKIAIIESNLRKDGRSYKRVLLDNVIFKRGSLNITKEGIEILDNVYTVLKLHPRSRIKIVGHTQLKDTNKTISKKKAESISSHLKKIKRVKGWRLNAAGMGREKPIEINGRMRTVDRVELVITGIR